MPNWLLSWVMPIVIQALTPVITELVKKVADWLGHQLPGAVVVSIAAGVGEAINQVQAGATGVPLPPGMSGLIAVALNELKRDLQNR
jgi:hypothetical protein